MAEPFANGWVPRPYQAEANERRRQGVQRMMLIWHRRAGKDAWSLNTADEMRRERVGTYWHLFPEHAQAKRAIWYGIDKGGTRFIDQAFPPSERVATRANDMQIEFANGSIWQMAGSDRYNSLVGSNPVGVFFSEWALCDPRALDFIRPIIRENGGFMAFITTYRARNHAYRMVQRLKNNPNWYIDVRTVNDTTRNDGRPVITAEDVQLDRDDGMREALIQQEYYCNPMAAVEGAVYGRAFERMDADDRLGSVMYDPALPVVAAWSTEYDDQYSVIFTQKRGNSSRIIASESVQFASISDALDKIDGRYPWRHVHRHVVPPESTSELMQSFENRSQVVEPAPNLGDVTKVTRERLGLTRIDNDVRPWTEGEPNNEHVVDALNGYAYTQNKAGAFTIVPANTYEKHFCRALEVYALWGHHGAESTDGWYPAPSTDQRDKAVI